jgi:serine/threonine protein kinase
MVDEDETKFEGGAEGHAPLFYRPEIVDRTSMLTEESGLGLPNPGVPDTGAILLRRYVLEERLGAGGMGVVWKAKDIYREQAEEKEIHVALKVLNPELASNKQAVRGLQREATRSTSLSHENIIRVHDFYIDEDNVILSMEYLKGVTLNNVIKDASYRGGMTLKQAWPIIKGMASALAYAHRNNIVHSDFKPGNVFLTDSNEVKVLDFGIAAKFDPLGDPDKTIFDPRSGEGFAVTPRYASFEMLNGGKADPRDDVYAFGLVVYELLTGNHPYDRKSASDVFLEQQRSGKRFLPKPVRSLNRRQWKLLKSAMELLQEQRPKRLDEWLDQFDPTAKWPSVIVGGGAVAAVSVAAGLGIWWTSSQNPTDQVKASSPSSPLTPVVSPSVETTRIPPQMSPTANAGQNRQTELGTLVKLDGSLSRTSDGGPMTYAWRLKEIPIGSQAVMMNSASAAPEFMADKEGAYTAELTVTDDRNQISVPSTVQIDVTKAKLQPPSHVGVSTDGILSLEASKASYKIGDELKLKIKTAKSGYLRVAYISSQGEVSELLPNDFQPSKVKADVEYRIPPKPNSFSPDVS